MGQARTASTLRRTGRALWATLACAGGLLAAEAALAACGGPQALSLAQGFYAGHYAFYHQPTPGLRDWVTPAFHAALQNHYRCARQHGQCHIDHDPWLGAQDGEVTGPVTYSLQGVDARQAVVVLRYRFAVANEPPAPREVRLRLRATAAPRCWQVDDLHTPLGDSLAARYRTAM